MAKFLRILCLFVLFCGINAKSKERDKCAHGGILKNMHLEGGIHSNKYEVVKGVSSMKGCIEKCCVELTCDLAMFSRNTCYSVNCAGDDACKISHANGKSKETAQIAFMTRTKEDVEKKRKAQLKAKREREKELADEKKAREKKLADEKKAIEKKVREQVLAEEAKGRKAEQEEEEKLEAEERTERLKEERSEEAELVKEEADEEKRKSVEKKAIEKEKAQKALLKKKKLNSTKVLERSKNIGDGNKNEENEVNNSTKSAQNNEIKEELEEGDEFKVEEKEKEEQIKDEKMKTKNDGYVIDGETDSDEEESKNLEDGEQLSEFDDNDYESGQETNDGGQISNGNNTETINDGTKSQPRRDQNDMVQVKSKTMTSKETKNSRLATDNPNKSTDMKENATDTPTDSPTDGELLTELAGISDSRKVGKLSTDDTASEASVKLNDNKNPTWTYLYQNSFPSNNASVVVASPGGTSSYSMNVSSSQGPYSQYSSSYNSAPSSYYSSYNNYAGQGSVFQDSYGNSSNTSHIPIQSKILEIVNVTNLNRIKGQKINNFNKSNVFIFESLSNGSKPTLKVTPTRDGFVTEIASKFENDEGSTTDINEESIEVVLAPNGAVSTKIEANDASTNASNIVDVKNGRNASGENNTTKEIGYRPWPSHHNTTEGNQTAYDKDSNAEKFSAFSGDEQVSGDGTPVENDLETGSGFEGAIEEGDAVTKVPQALKRAFQMLTNVSETSVSDENSYSRSSMGKDSLHKPTKDLFVREIQDELASGSGRRQNDSEIKSTNASFSDENEDNVAATVPELSKFPTQSFISRETQRKDSFDAPDPAAIDLTTFNQTSGETSSTNSTSQIKFIGNSTTAENSTASLQNQTIDPAVRNATFATNDTRNDTGSSIDQSISIPHRQQYNGSSPDGTPALLNQTETEPTLAAEKPIGDVTTSQNTTSDQVSANDTVAFTPTPVPQQMSHPMAVMTSSKQSPDMNKTAEPKIGRTSGSSADTSSTSGFESTSGESSGLSGKDETDPNLLYQTTRRSHIPWRDYTPSRKSFVSPNNNENHYYFDERSEENNGQSNTEKQDDEDAEKEDHAAKKQKNSQQLSPSNSTEEAESETANVENDQEESKHEQLISQGLIPVSQLKNTSNVDSDSEEQNDNAANKELQHQKKAVTGQKDEGSDEAVPQENEEENAAASNPMINTGIPADSPLGKMLTAHTDQQETPIELKSHSDAKEEEKAHDFKEVSFPDSAEADASNDEAETSKIESPTEEMKLEKLKTLRLGDPLHDALGIAPGKLKPELEFPESMLLENPSSDLQQQPAENEQQEENPQNSGAKSNINNEAASSTEKTSDPSNNEIVAQGGERNIQILDNDDIAEYNPAKGPAESSSNPAEGDQKSKDVNVDKKDSLEKPNKKSTKKKTTKESVGETVVIDQLKSKNANFNSIAWKTNNGKKVFPIQKNENKKKDDKKEEKKKKKKTKKKKKVSKKEKNNKTNKVLPGDDKLNFLHPIQHHLNLHGTLDHVTFPVEKVQSKTMLQFPHLSAPMRSMSRGPDVFQVQKDTYKNLTRLTKLFEGSLAQPTLKFDHVDTNSTFVKNHTLEHAKKLAKHIVKILHEKTKNKELSKMAGPDLENTITNALHKINTNKVAHKKDLCCSNPENMTAEELKHKKIQDRHTSNQFLNWKGQNGSHARFVAHSAHTLGLENQDSRDKIQDALEDDTKRNVTAPNLPPAEIRNKSLHEKLTEVSMTQNQSLVEKLEGSYDTSIQRAIQTLHEKSKMITSDNKNRSLHEKLTDVTKENPENFISNKKHEKEIRHTHHHKNVHSKKKGKKKHLLSRQITQHGHDANHQYEHPMIGHRYGGSTFQMSHNVANHNFNPQPQHHGNDDGNQDNHSNDDYSDLTANTTDTNNDTEVDKTKQFARHLKTHDKKKGNLESTRLQPHGLTNGKMSRVEEYEVRNKLGTYMSLASSLSRKLGSINHEHLNKLKGVKFHPGKREHRRLQKVKEAREKIADKFLINDKCKRGLSVRGATLRGGVLSGEFKSMGVVATQRACVEQCCNNKRCDVAMTIGRECINIRCFNRKLCNIAPAGNLAVYRDVLPVVTFVNRPKTIDRRSEIPHPFAVSEEGPYSVSEIIRQLDESEFDEIRRIVDNVNDY